MKIVFIGTRRLDSIGGIENYMYNLTRRLTELGIQCVVYCESDHWGTEICNGVKIYHLRSLPSRFLTKPILGVIAMLHAILFVDNISLIHCNQWFSTAGAVFAWLAKIPLVMECHGLEWQRTKYTPRQQKIIHLMEYIFARTIHNLIVCSQNQCDYYKMHYHRNPAVVTGGCDIPVSDFISNESDYLKKWNLRKDGYFIFLGRLVQDKNVDLLIRSFQKTPFPNGIRLVIAGSNFQQPQYVQHLRKLAEGNRNILFTGDILNDEKSALLKNSLAFILPSVMEGLPIALLEAMSFRCRCIVSDIPGNMEVASDCAVIVKLNSEDDLSEKMHQIANSPDANESLRNLARQKVDRFSWMSIAKKYLTVAQTIAKKSSCSQVHSLLWMSLILVGAFLIRFHVSHENPMLSRDAIGLVEKAICWFESGRIVMPVSAHELFVSWKPPLLTAIMASGMNFGFSPVNVGLCFNLFCGVLLVLSVYLIALEMFEKRSWAFLCAVLAAVHPSLVRFSTIIQREAPYLLCASFLFYAVLTGIKRKSILPWCVAGIATAVGLGFRLESGEFPFFILIILGIFVLKRQINQSELFRICVAYFGTLLLIGVLICLSMGEYDIFSGYYFRRYLFIAGTAHPFDDAGWIPLAVPVLLFEPFFVISSIGFVLFVSKHIKTFSTTFIIIVAIASFSLLWRIFANNLMVSKRYYAIFILYAVFAAGYGFQEVGRKGIIGNVVSKLSFVFLLILCIGKDFHTNPFNRYLIDGLRCLSDQIPSVRKVKLYTNKLEEVSRIRFYTHNQFEIGALADSDELDCAIRREADDWDYQYLILFSEKNARTPWSGKESLYFSFTNRKQKGTISIFRICKGDGDE